MRLTFYRRKIFEYLTIGFHRYKWGSKILFSLSNVFDFDTHISLNR